MNNYDCRAIPTIAVMDLPVPNVDEAAQGCVGHIYSFESTSLAVSSGQTSMKL